MSHPVFWPSKTFFYPLGNTAAYSLTQDLSPEQPADILLLGCGDPRNILFTLWADVVTTSTPRKFDVTCCDIEPSILARNILLFVLINDNESIDVIWDTFFHFKINDQASEIITRQSQRLHDHAQDIESWRQSPYGSFIQFFDACTLTEVRSRWKSYADFINLSDSRRDKLLQQQSALTKSVLKDYGFNYSASRSAGMLWPYAATAVSELFKKYWETGTMFTRDSDVQDAKNLNPTFIYSVQGEVFNPHYGTFPQGFHLAPAFAPTVSNSQKSGKSRTVSAVADLMKDQLRAWISSFRVSRAAGSIVVRSFSGDAIAFCRALDIYVSTGKTATGVFVSSWRGSQIHLDELNTATPPTPTSFDVIDTSNLTDHLGLLNLLTATRPLLKERPPSQSVLYTETLLPAGDDATKSFLDRICATVPTLSALLGVAPRAYISAFTTHSNTHELLSPARTSQYHERIAWIKSYGGDRHANDRNVSVSFDAEGLARVVFGIYKKMFAGENAMAAVLSKPSPSKFKSMSEVHYHRESLALLLQLVKRRVLLKPGDWNDFGDKLLKFVERDTDQMPGLNVYYQDLCLQLHRYNVHTVATLAPNWTTQFRADNPSHLFQNWSNIPPVVYVVLTVPRKKIQTLVEDNANIGTPTLECHVTTRGLYSNGYSAIQTVWGRLISPPGSDIPTFQEDAEGIRGQSDLIVTFLASSRVLQFENTSVALAIKITPQTAAMFMMKLGMELAIFSASITDDTHVRVASYRPVLDAEEQVALGTTFPELINPLSTNITASVMAELDSKSESCDVVSFTAHVDINSVTEQEALLNKAEVNASQISPCAMRLLIAGYDHIVLYPYPVLGVNHSLRIARKSHWVEVIAPISKPLDSGGYYLDRTPIIRIGSYSPWNFHHIHPERLPMLNLSDSKKLDWLDSHTALQLSDRERDIRDGDLATKAAAINMLVNVKESIHAIVVNCSGVQGHKTRAIGLREPDQGGIYAILLVGALRLDLASFTVIVDTALVPLSEERMSSLMPHIQKLQNVSPVTQVETSGHEMTAWKRLLPTYVERCRNWTHKPNCEYAATGDIPLSAQIDHNPICTCGQGIGFNGPEWDVESWKGLLPFATRAAISSLFAVSYIETVAGKAQALFSDRPVAPEPGKALDKIKDVCWLCGGPGNPTLSTCSRCKKAMYCSSACQRQDWPIHKKKCPKN